MRVIRNAGTDRVVDLLRPALQSVRQLDLVTPALSLFAFAELLPDLRDLADGRAVLPPEAADLRFLGADTSQGDLPANLVDSTEHVRPERTENDILHEALRKLGLDPCVPIDVKKIARKNVHSIGGGVLLTCLAEKIARDDAEPLAQGIAAWHKELKPAGDTTCIFRHSAFAADVAKADLTENLKQHGLTTVRSL